MTEEQETICLKCRQEFEVEHPYSNFHCPFVNKKSCVKYNPNYKPKPKRTEEGINDIEEIECYRPIIKIEV